MKKIIIAAVGKIKENYWIEAIDEYKKRLSRFCELKVIELDEFNSHDGIIKESESLLKLKDIDFLLDINGDLVSSEDLSRLIDTKFLIKDNITFVIGGSKGVDFRVKQKAEKLISFGRVTYPHQLMRVLLSEQIYRAFTILNNMPYHK